MYTVFNEISMYIDGGYTWSTANQSASRDDFCCSRSKNPYATEWRNRDVISALDLLQPEWRNILGWIPFYNASLQLYDMHTEFHTLAVHLDCTHFIYSPLSYSYLWWSIADTLMHLLSSTG
jgi:hypothetical protein